jgi:hypothetical protein
MFQDILDEAYPVNNEPKDDTTTIQVMLYFSEPEVEEFKKLSKNLMKRYWPTDYTEKANISDLLLKLLRDANAKT